MYIPKSFKEVDEDVLLEFMQKNNFAALVSVQNKVPAATHLPLIVEKSDKQIITLSGHMAKKNQQWKYFEPGKEILIIFRGAHSYVSPTLYEEKENVPTWDFTTVHAYGTPIVFFDKEKYFEIMEKSFNCFEPEFKKKWNELSKDYIDDLMSLITAFEIKVTRLEGQFKLSQNKSVKERENIINFFEKGTNIQKELAEFMKKYYSKNNYL